MSDDKLIPDVDTPPAPSLPIGEAKKTGGSTIFWRQAFAAEVRKIVAQLKTEGIKPLVKDIVALFPSEKKEHQWEDGTLIKSRRRIWVQEVRRALRKHDSETPLLNTIKRTRKAKVKKKVNLFGD